jgi:hypothetical protein
LPSEEHLWAQIPAASIVDTLDYGLSDVELQARAGAEELHLGKKSRHLLRRVRQEAEIVSVPKYELPAPLMVDETYPGGGLEKAYQRAYNKVGNRA